MYTVTRQGQHHNIVEAFSSRVEAEAFISTQLGGCHLDKVTSIPIDSSLYAKAPNPPEYKVIAENYADILLAEMRQALKDGLKERYRMQNL